MINTECENFHSRETLSKTLSNKTAGTLVTIHPELQKKKKFPVLTELLFGIVMNRDSELFISVIKLINDEILHTTAQSA